MAEPFYRYTDSEGDVHIVDRIDQVPDLHRADVERVRVAAGSDARVQGRPIDGAQRAVERLRSQAREGLPGVVADLHGPSVAVGFGAAVLLFAMARLVAGVTKGRGGWLVGAGLMVAACLSGAAYLGWVRRSVGLGNETFVSPTQVVDDARNAARKMKDRWQKQERALREIEERLE